ncbi:MAG: hypothetical protein KC713_05085, partial [Candidatus Omnitrophica bacterium]|nr:hypothetical protein [Candidatus Omnitrophota bacterium]
DPVDERHSILWQDGKFIGVVERNELGNYTPTFLNNAAFFREIYLNENIIKKETLKVVRTSDKNPLVGFSLKTSSGKRDVNYYFEYFENETGLDLRGQFLVLIYQDNQSAKVYHNGVCLGKIVQSQRSLRDSNLIRHYRPLNPDHLSLIERKLKKLEDEIAKGERASLIRISTSIIVLKTQADQGKWSATVSNRIKQIYRSWLDMKSRREIDEMFKKLKTHFENYQTRQDNFIRRVFAKLSEEAYVKILTNEEKCLLAHYKEHLELLKNEVKQKYKEKSKRRGSKTIRPKRLNMVERRKAGLKKNRAQMLEDIALLRGWFAEKRDHDVITAVEELISMNQPFTRVFHRQYQSLKTLKRRSQERLHRINNEKLLKEFRRAVDICEGYIRGRLQTHAQEDINKIKAIYRGLLVEKPHLNKSIKRLEKLYQQYFQGKGSADRKQAEKPRSAQAIDVRPGSDILKTAVRKKRPVDGGKKYGKKRLIDMYSVYIKSVNVYVRIKWSDGSVILGEIIEAEHAAITQLIDKITVRRLPTQEVKVFKFPLLNFHEFRCIDPKTTQEVSLETIVMFYKKHLKTNKKPQAPPPWDDNSSNLFSFSFHHLTLLFLYVLSHLQFIAPSYFQFEYSGGLMLFIGVLSVWLIPSDYSPQRLKTWVKNQLLNALNLVVKPRVFDGKTHKNPIEFVGLRQFVAELRDQTQSDRSEGVIYEQTLFWMKTDDELYRTSEEQLLNEILAHYQLKVPGPHAHLHVLKWINLITLSRQNLYKQFAGRLQWIDPEYMPFAVSVLGVLQTPRSLACLTLWKEWNLYSFREEIKKIPRWKEFVSTEKRLDLELADHFLWESKHFFYSLSKVFDYRSEEEEKIKGSFQQQVYPTRELVTECADHYTLTAIKIDKTHNGYVLSCADAYRGKYRYSMIGLGPERVAHVKVLAGINLKRTRTVVALHGFAIEFLRSLQKKSEFESGRFTRGDQMMWYGENRRTNRYAGEGYLTITIGYSNTANPIKDWRRPMEVVVDEWYEPFKKLLKLNKSGQPVIFDSESFGTTFFLLMLTRLMKDYLKGIKGTRWYLRQFSLVFAGNPVIALAERAVKLMNVEAQILNNAKMTDVIPYEILISTHRRHQDAVEDIIQTFHRYQRRMKIRKMVPFYEEPLKEFKVISFSAIPKKISLLPATSFIFKGLDWILLKTARDWITPETDIVGDIEPFRKTLDRLEKLGLDAYFFKWVNITKLGTHGDFPENRHFMDIKLRLMDFNAQKKNLDRVKIISSGRWVERLQSCRPKDNMCLKGDNIQFCDDHGYSRNLDIDFKLQFKDAVPQIHRIISLISSAFMVLVHQGMLIDTNILEHNKLLLKYGIPDISNSLLSRLSPYFIKIYELLLFFMVPFLFSFSSYFMKLLSLTTTNLLKRLHKENIPVLLYLSVIIEFVRKRAFRKELIRQTKYKLRRIAYKIEVRLYMEADIFALLVIRIYYILKLRTLEFDKDKIKNTYNRFYISLLRQFFRKYRYREQISEQLDSVLVDLAGVKVKFAEMHFSNRLDYLTRLKAKIREMLRLVFRNIRK